MRKQALITATGIMSLGLGLAALVPYAGATVLTVLPSTEVLWHFDEGSGTTVDDASPNNRDGTVSATLMADPGAWVAGDAGHGNAIFQQSPDAPGQFRAVSANGLAVPLDLGAMDAFTIEMRFNATQWSNNDPFFTIGNGFGRIALRAPSTVVPNQEISELQIVYDTGGANTTIIPLRARS